MSSPSKFEIRLMNKNDYDQVLSLLTNSFFPDEPITRCLKITKTCEFARNVINDCLKHKCSFVAYDTETNQIVGVCLNEITNKNVKDKVTDENAEDEVIKSREQFNFILQLFRDVHNKRNVYDELNANTLLHIFIISVAEKARRQKLASRLISKSIEYAKDNLKVNGAYAEATSVSSSEGFKQQNFEVFNELIYADYNPKRLASLNDKKYDRCYLVARKF